MSNTRGQAPMGRRPRGFNSSSSAASSDGYRHGTLNMEEQASERKISNRNLNTTQRISEDRDDESEYASAHASLNRDEPDFDERSEISNVQDENPMLTRFKEDLSGPDTTLGFIRFSSDIDPPNGKKSIRLSARELAITWGADENYWYWEYDKDSRSGEVAVLKEVWWFEIKGTTSFTILSPETLYTVYLVYKLAQEAEGFKQPNHQIAEIEFKNTKTKKTVQLDSNKIVTHDRATGWNQIMIGEFSTRFNTDGLVHVKLRGTDTEVSKKGLIIEGMEFRAES